VGRLYSRAELLEQRARWKSQRQRVVFTNGCYDIVHPGHIRLIEYARSCGDVLIVALNTDAGVRRLKGPCRPLNAEQERAGLMAALDAVDAVILFEEETPRELIAELLPDILIKGSDWSHFIAGREEVEAAGGTVITAPLLTGFSTTSILEKLLTVQP
jgi:rfaE bifunctional protein nucleotidyltransferase chain/domain